MGRKNKKQQFLPLDLSSEHLAKGVANQDAHLLVCSALSLSISKV